MPIIQKLAPHVADLIAAGEVVERPAGAAKELVENAIDAGAKNITVEIENGGMTFIRVTDDGCGMEPEDAETAFLRHATSKLRTAQDLEAISTLGFRGEALAAISAVSRIDLLTKTRNSTFGTSLHLEAGVITEKDQAGCPDGTTIIVRDLFYNTPARMKFMKRDTVEGSALVGAVAKLALAHPEVSVRILKDGQEQLQTVGDGELLSAIRTVMGRQTAKNMVPVDSHWDKYSVTGYVSRPTDTRGTRSNQLFFVNGRLVRSGTMSAALEEAYRNRLMVGRHPSCVLHVHLPEHLVDVNVHPTKIEVKFLNEHEIFDCVHYGVKGALDGAPARENLQLPKQPGMTAQVSQPAPAPEIRKPVIPAPQKEEGDWNVGPAPRVSSPRIMTAAEYRNFAKVLKEAPEAKPSKGVLDQIFGTAEPEKNPGAPEKKPEPPKPEKLPEQPAKAPEIQEKPEEIPSKQEEFFDKQIPMEEAQETLPLPEKGWRLVGEIFRTYLIVEEGKNVLLIDKHAAHERLLFEKFRKQAEPIVPQLLLAPILCTLPRESAAVLLEHGDRLEEYGFEVSDYGDGTLAVHELPADLDPSLCTDTLLQLAEDLQTGRHLKPEELRDNLLHTIACKAAIKGGWVTDPLEHEAIVKEVLSRDDLKYCPHGRPICIQMTEGQLERQFRR